MRRTALILFALTLSVSHCRPQQLDLTETIISTEQIVLNLATKAKELYYTKRCDFQCTCSYASCFSKLPSPTCDMNHGKIADTCKTDGRRISFDKTTVRIAGLSSPSTSLSAAVKESECWTQSLEPTLKELVTNDTSNAITWLFFAMPTGVFRRFPGHADRSCAYDPRTRPWYTSATSGPKDIVLILDVSGSMENSGRLGLAKQAAATVLNTLTFSDFVNVVAFSDNARVIGQSTGNLMQASIASVKDLVTKVTGLSSGGGTNYKAAFDLAFQLFGQSREYTSRCQRAILFLTDGQPDGLVGDPLVSYVTNLNQNWSATLFMYTLGSGLNDDAKAISRKLACNSNGIYTHIDEGGNLVGAMGYYYQYYATARQAKESAVFWAEPFQETTGGVGLVTGPSTAVYDDRTDPPTLIGVASMNIALTYFLAIDPNTDNVLKTLTARSVTCPAFKLDKCQLESFRARDASGVASPDSLCGVTNCTIKETTPPLCNSGQNVPFCGSPRSSYLEEECCQSTSSLTVGAIIGIAVGSVGLIVLIIIATYLLTASSSDVSIAAPKRDSW